MRNLTDWVYPTLKPLSAGYYASRRKLWFDQLDREEQTVSNETDAEQRAGEKASQLEQEKERNSKAKERAQEARSRFFHILTGGSGLLGIATWAFSPVTKAGGSSSIPHILSLGTTFLAGGALILIYIMFNTVRGLWATSKALQPLSYPPDPNMNLSLKSADRLNDLARRRAETTLEWQFQTDRIISQCKLTDCAFRNVVAGFAALIVGVVAGLIYISNATHTVPAESLQDEPRKETSHSPGGIP